MKVFIVGSFFLFFSLSSFAEENSSADLKEAKNRLDQAYSEILKSKEIIQQAAEDLQDPHCSDQKMRRVFELLDLFEVKPYSLDLYAPLSIPTLKEIKPVVNQALSSFATQNIRTHFFHVTLNSQSQLSNGTAISDIKLSIKMPENFSENLTYPVVFMASGMETGRNTLDLLESNTQNILISIDYPTTDLKRNVKNNEQELLQATKQNLNLVEQTPYHMALALMWIYHQTWAEKINVMGISYGGFVLPSALTIAQMNGVVIDSFIFAYTGGDYASLIGSTKEFKSRLGFCEQKVLSQVVSKLTGEFDPVNHLKRIPNTKSRKNVLFVEGREDQIIPAEVSKAFKQKLPASTDTLTLDGGHINPDKPELILEFKTQVFQWLKKNNYVN